MDKIFHGPLPPIGARIRHYHPWLEDHAVGVVVRYELVSADLRRDSVDGEFYGRYQVHLTDCMHWRSDGSWGPVPDTFFDNINEAWMWDDGDNAESGLETTLPTARTSI